MTAIEVFDALQSRNRFWEDSFVTMKISTYLIVDAARATRDIYKSNAIKLAKHHPDSIGIFNEIRRTALMDALCHDENLCEMFAGRIHQLSHGVKG